MSLQPSHGSVTHLKMPKGGHKQGSSLFPLPCQPGIESPVFGTRKSTGNILSLTVVSVFTSSQRTKSRLRSFSPWPWTGSMQIALSHLGHPQEKVPFCSYWQPPNDQKEVKAMHLPHTLQQVSQHKRMCLSTILPHIQTGLSHQNRPTETGSLEAANCS